MQRAASLAGVVLGVLSGCSLSPRYQRPSVPAPPDSYKEAGAWKLAAPADSTPRGRWWTMFQERELDDLESQVSDANQSLRAALARLDQARAQTRIARSAWFPALTAQANATRSRTSLSSPSYTPGKPAIGNIFTAQGDLSYELDLFGRVRNTVAGARASEQASAGDVAALDLTVRAELASDYFTLRGLDAEQQLLDHTVADYARALQLTQNLYHGGAAAIADVLQAQAQLESARTLAEDTRLRRAQTEHAIAVLVGRSAGADDALRRRPARCTVRRRARCLRRAGRQLPRHGARGLSGRRGQSRGFAPVAARERESGGGRCRDARGARPGEPALQGRARDLPRGRVERKRRTRGAPDGGRHQHPPHQRHGAPGQSPGRGLAAALSAPRADTVSVNNARCGRLWSGSDLAGRRQPARLWEAP